jgi:hypothetical protein
MHDRQLRQRLQRQPMLSVGVSMVPTSVCSQERSTFAKEQHQAFEAAPAAACISQAQLVAVSVFSLFFPA